MAHFVAAIHRGCGDPCPAAAANFAERRRFCIRIRRGILVRGQSVRMRLIDGDHCHWQVPDVLDLNLKASVQLLWKTQLPSPFVLR